MGDKEKDFIRATWDEHPMGGLLKEFRGSYKILVELFGEPHIGDYKTTYEWIVKHSESGVCFSIYDYKFSTNYYSEDSGRPTPDEMKEMNNIEWHIGGFDHVKFLSRSRSEYDAGKAEAKMLSIRLIEFIGAEEYDFMKEYMAAAKKLVEKKG